MDEILQTEEIKKRINRFTTDDARKWLDEHGLEYSTLRTREQLIDLITLHITKNKTSFNTPVNDKGTRHNINNAVIKATPTKMLFSKVTKEPLIKKKENNDQQLVKDDGCFAVVAAGSAAQKLREYRNDNGDIKTSEVMIQVNEKQTINNILIKDTTTKMFICKETKELFTKDNSNNDQIIFGKCKDIGKNDCPAISADDNVAQKLENHCSNNNTLETRESKMQPVNSSIGNQNQNVRIHRDEQEMNQSMQNILIKDTTTKKNLLEMYQQVETFIEINIDKETKEVLTKKYGDFDKLLFTKREDVEENECTIVVAGDTGAGKSSLINLFLGTEVLPTPMPDATPVIVCIHNSQLRKLEIHEGGTLKSIPLKLNQNDQDFIGLAQQIKEILTGQTKDGKSKYDQIDIYWPTPILQDCITIVDTPGVVDESEEITEKILKYISNAVALIYVTDSGNSKGIQDDKLIRIVLERTRRTPSFTSANMIFVCNKWDIVKKNNKQDEYIWTDTLKNLTTLFPNFPKERIFKLSVTESWQCMKSGMGDTKELQKVMAGVRQLVEEGLQAKKKCHFEWLESCLDGVRKIFDSRIHHAKCQKIDRKKLHDDVRTRLKKLSNDARKVKANLIQNVIEQCEQLADSLHEFVMSSPESKQLLTFTETEIPDVVDDDIGRTRSKAEEIIQYRLQNLIKSWENDKLKKTADKLTMHLKTEFQLYGSKFNEIDHMIHGKGNDTSFPFETNTRTIAPSESLPWTTGEKVLFAIATPLWLPLFILALPLGLILVAHDFKKEKVQKKQYMQNKVQYMTAWTDNLVEKCFNKDATLKFINSTYRKTFEKDINKVFDQYIPRQIAADKQLMSVIQNDNRSAEDILSNCTSLKKKLNATLATLRLFRLQFLNEDIPSTSQIKKIKLLGGGSDADVYFAKWSFKTDEGNEEKDVALKVMRKSLLTELNALNQFDEVACLRKLNHKHIVKCYGVTYSSECADDVKAVESGSGPKLTLMILLELCDDTLQNMVFKDDSLKCCKYSTVTERHETFRFYCTMADGISSGLAHVHEKGFLHNDLKLSNILVKNNTPKLSDFGFVCFDDTISMSLVGTLTHMAPEVLRNRMYTCSSDIYSFGVLLWELWYGQHAYLSSDDSLLSLGTHQASARPDCQLRHAMKEEITELVNECWHDEPEKRPKANVLPGRIRSIFAQVHSYPLH